MKKNPICSAMQLSLFANFAYIVDSTNVPLKYFTVAFTPRVVLY